MDNTKILECVRKYIADRSDFRTRPDMNSEKNLVELYELILAQSAHVFKLKAIEACKPKGNEAWSRQEVEAGERIREIILSIPTEEVDRNDNLHRNPVDKIGNLHKDENLSTAQPVAQSEKGEFPFKVVVDPTMPPDTLEFYQDGKHVGSIINLEQPALHSSEAPTASCDHEETTVGYDQVTCNKCRWILPSGQRIGPHYGWFPSHKAHKEFKDYGTYPGIVIASPLPAPMPEDVKDYLKKVAGNDDLLEKMVEAYSNYQRPTDRGLSQQLTGMQLAVLSLISLPVEEK